MAATKGNLDIVKLLVEKGSDIFVPDVDGYHPLHVSALRPHFEDV